MRIFIFRIEQLNVGNLFDEGRREGGVSSIILVTKLKLQPKTKDTMNRS